MFFHVFSLKYFGCGWFLHVFFVYVIYVIILHLNNEILFKKNESKLSGGGCPPDSLCGRLWPGGGVENHGWLPPVYSH